jgi:hypothetical protein
VLNQNVRLHVGLLNDNSVVYKVYHNINQSILVIDHQFKDTHLELIPINSGLNPLCKNVKFMGFIDH